MYRTGKFYVKLATPDGVTFPTHTSIETGSLFYRKDEQLLYIYSGSWNAIPVYAGTPNVGDALRWNGSIWVASGVVGGPGGSVSSFVDLDDVPTSYTGYGGYTVVVKDDELGLEFSAAAGGGDGGGGGNPFFYIDGTLASGTDLGAYVVTADSTITNIYLWGDILGSGTTIVDVHKRTSSDVPGTTIFTTQANRPSLISTDPDHVIKSTAPNVTSVNEGDVLSIDIDQVAAASSNLSVVIAMEPSGDSGSDTFGGNLVRNSPGQIVVDGAEPQWWDDIADAVITDEDAAGEACEDKTERVFKVVTAADDVYGLQTLPFADEDLLDAGQTVVSFGCWVWCDAAATASIGIYGTNLGLQESDQHTGGSGWEWLVVENQTLDGADADIEIRLIVDTDTAFFTMPSLTVGPVARPWVARGMLHVPIYVTQLDLNTTGDVAWTDTDHTANTDPLATMINASCYIGSDEIACYGWMGHSNAIVVDDYSLGVRIYNGSQPTTAGAVLQCDDSQILRYLVEEIDADSDVRFIIYAIGYWRWA